MVMTIFPRASPLSRYRSASGTCDSPYREFDGAEDREVLVGQAQTASSDGQKDRGEEARGEGRLLLGGAAQEAIQDSAAVHRGTAAMALTASRRACARAVVTAALAVADSVRRP